MSNYRDNLLPGAHARNEQDRAERNLIITPLSFEGEHIIQLRCGVAVLCTVSAPAGPSTPTMFHVYRENLNSREETNYDEVETIEQTFFVSSHGGWINDAWEAAVRYAYGFAIERVINELNFAKEPA